MEYKVKIENREDGWGGGSSQSIIDEQNLLHFYVRDLYDCPEDATIYRDLFNAYDYIDTLNKGIELAKMGYDKVTYENIGLD